ncbi:MAG: hypothetical protein A4E63_00130 [Syntrophorhabdus sp. PtaU1.Bin050]|nr:MAG: hypothetical protein A4E63_00130 [Syntrophorhabdus sp. PtaU1.Bin050]
MLIVLKNSIWMDEIRETTVALFEYCRRNNWAGYDPYDALNSRIFTHTPFFRSRICRIALTQIIKRLPVNIRPLLLIKKEENPKALALFLAAFLKLSKLGLLSDKDLIRSTVDKLVALRSLEDRYWCWGYSFPWQTRTIMVPRNAPNLVCTVFVANALLDVYETNSERRCLDMALSAARYMVNELFWTEGEEAGFSYPLPSSKSRVHNANFLGAALLCRVYACSGNDEFIEPALRATRYSVAKQYPNGSWDYGELPTQRWVDNFHTGYNLCALRSIGRSINTEEFELAVQRGFAFYYTHFFEDKGAPKYFHDRTYPIDIHSVAQSIITFLTFCDLNDSAVKRALSVLTWSIKNMWNEHGYFYHQTFPFFKNKISYMRWAQAWMLLALSSLLETLVLAQDGVFAQSYICNEW